jgi:hypothetical protein
MEKANKITSIVLKMVAILAIIAVSFFYCINSGNDRYSLPTTEGIFILDKKTGSVYYFKPREAEVLSGKWTPFGSFQDRQQK